MTDYFTYLYYGADDTSFINGYSSTPPNDIIIPAIDPSGYTIKGVFNLSNSDIETVTFSPEINNISIGDNAFADCTNLRTIYFNSNSLSLVGNYAFKNCSSLLDFNTLSTCSSYGDNAFENCTSIQINYFNNIVTHLGSNIFKNTPNIKSITFAGENPDLNNDIFTGSYVNTIYYYSQYRDSWKNLVLDNITIIELSSTSCLLNTKIIGGNNYLIGQVINDININELLKLF